MVVPKRAERPEKGITISPLRSLAMTLHPPSLLLAFLVALLLAAAVLTSSGWHGRAHRGHRWWVSAQWLLLAGLALQLAIPLSAPAAWLAHLLVLQWPISVLAGLRRFYSRHGLPIPGGMDAAVLLLAWLAVPIAVVQEAPRAWQNLAWCAGPAALQLYAAWLLSRLGEFRDTPELKWLALTLAFVGAASLFPLFEAGQSPLASIPAASAAGLLTTLPALLLVPFALLLSFRRSEHTSFATQRKLRYLADMDVLTRVPNRRHFQELATDALRTIKADNASVLMFDIDHFRRINDMFGHASGDDALRQVSECMRETLREPDVAGRLGGDQFAILLPDTASKGAMVVASRIVTQLATRQVAPRIAPLSLSFGVVSLLEHETIADAIRRAEQALHEAKRQGRSRVVVATGSSDKPVFTNSRTLGLVNV